MLTDWQRPGSIGSGSPLIKSEAFREELIDFIAEQLPIWEARPDRNFGPAETILNSSLCAHLTAAARLSGGWDILQFRVEEFDTTHVGRKLDIVASTSIA